MDLYDKMFNITNKNIKKEINDAIEFCQHLITNTNRMCIISSNIIYKYLQDQHVLAKIVNTTDLGVGYEHEAVIVKDSDNYFLIDFTYDQFLNAGTILNKELLKNKYIQLDNNTFNSYLDSIPNFINFKMLILMIYFYLPKEEDRDHNFFHFFKFRY